MLKDYYSILGISFNASEDEIKRAYRAMSRKWHPDTNPGIDTTAIMQDINEAYYVLKDPLTKARYDAEYSNGFKVYGFQDVVLRKAIKKAKESAASYVRRIISNWAHGVYAILKDEIGYALVALPKLSVAIAIIFNVTLHTLCGHYSSIQQEYSAKSSRKAAVQHKKSVAIPEGQILNAIRFNNLIQQNNENTYSIADKYIQR